MVVHARQGMTLHAMAHSTRQANSRNVENCNLAQWCATWLVKRLDRLPGAEPKWRGTGVYG
jgi:hypothetical protein